MILIEAVNIEKALKRWNLAQLASRALKAFKDLTVDEQDEVISMAIAIQLPNIFE